MLWLIPHPLVNNVVASNHKGYLYLWNFNNVTRWMPILTSNTLTVITSTNQTLNATLAITLIKNNELSRAFC